MSLAPEFSSDWAVTAETASGTSDSALAAPRGGDDDVAGGYAVRNLLCGIGLRLALDCGIGDRPRALGGRVLRGSRRGHGNEGGGHQIGGGAHRHLSPQRPLGAAFELLVSCRVEPSNDVRVYGLIADGVRYSRRVSPYRSHVQPRWTRETSLPRRWPPHRRLRGATKNMKSPAYLGASTISICRPSMRG